jgi:restriction endonuclease S subunit
VTTGEIQFTTITETAEKITEAGLKNSSAKLFPPGTLLMAMYGQGKTRGQVAKLGIEASTNQACAAILLHDGHDAEFYFHYVTAHYESLRELGNTGTQQNLNGGILKCVEVPVPPIEEQRRTAQILSTWDAAGAAMEATLPNRKAQWHALLAISLHLPPATPDCIFIGDNGGCPASVQPGIPNLTAAPTGWQRIPLGQHLSEVRRPAVMRPDHISKTERWLKWPFNIPPLPVQQRIVEVLDTERREMDLIAAQIDRLKQEKAALMADLLTGRRRVKPMTDTKVSP